MLKAYKSLNPNNAAVALEDIHPEPIGSGSIAQVNTMKPHRNCESNNIAKVHRAKLVGLAPNAALHVVVKVLHPSVREHLLLDTQVRLMKRAISNVNLVPSIAHTSHSDFLHSCQFDIPAPFCMDIRLRCRSRAVQRTPSGTHRAAAHVAFAKLAS